jgi:hypothetical protein
MKDIIIRLKIKREVNLNNKLSSGNELSLNSNLKYKTFISNIKYNKEFIKMTIYLIIFKKLKDINALEFHRFKREVLKYKVYK